VISDNITLILSLSFLIWFSPFVARAIRLPIPVIEITLGSVLAYFGFIGHNPHFDLVATVGFLYLMFLAGMEVDLKAITRSSRFLRRRALFFLLVVTLISITGGLLFHFNTIVIISMPLISIGLLASLSKQYGQKLWLKIAFITGLLGEISSIAVLTVFDAASTTGFNVHLAEKIAYLAGFLAIVYILYKALQLLFWWFPELKRALVPRFDTSDQDIRLAMALFFILIAVMRYLELELALGSFIAGTAIAAFFKQEKRLEEKISGFGFGFLVPIFFIHVGASFDIEALRIDGVISGALLITATMIVARLVASVTLFALEGAYNALLSSLSLSMPLTLLIAVATIGYEAKLLDLLSYYQLVLASIFEILIVMSMLKFLAERKEKKKRVDQSS
jgi:Kef-type K+ transport system membrane component KefB